MDTQTITKDDLKAIYNIACESWKSKLENYAKRQPFDSIVSLTQGEVDEMFSAATEVQKNTLIKFLKPDLDICDKIYSFEDACTILNINPHMVFSRIDSVDEIAFKKLKIIIKALNNGWAPNWKDQSEYKWWNWFTINKTGAFVYYDTHYNSCNMCVPSALCFKTEKLAKHCVKIALDLYQEYYLG